MIDTPTNEVPTPAVAVENPVVPNASAPPAAASEPLAGAAPAVGAEAPSILKSELQHVFEAFEHFSLMEGISRLYALAKKHL